MEKSLERLAWIGVVILAFSAAITATMIGILVADDFSERYFKPVPPPGIVMEVGSIVPGTTTVDGDVFPGLATNTTINAVITPCETVGRCTNPPAADEPKLTDFYTPGKWGDVENWVISCAKEVHVGRDCRCTCDCKAGR